MDGVVILHGLGHTARFMAPLEQGLRDAGFATLNLSYQSKSRDFSWIIADLGPQIAAFAESLDGALLHFVGHSMGGLVTRGLIHAHRPKNLGRVVMLGTPNQGSAIANKMRALGLDGLLIGKAITLLATDRPTELAAQLGEVDYPLGVIAGNVWLDGLSGWMLSRPNDGKVTIASTKVAGLSDHIILPVGHTFMPWQKNVIAQTVAFLRTGIFERATVSN